MDRKVVSGVMLALLLIGVLTLAFNIQPARAEPTTIIVPDQYGKIQWAIGNATAGDTIYVRAGTYDENILVNKRLSLIGEDRYTTIIDGGKRTGAAVRVAANNVVISSFTMQNAGTGAGIYLYYADYCNITDNIVTNNPYGIYLYLSDYNNVSCNIITNSRDYGLFVRHSSYNTFIGNDITNNFSPFTLASGVRLEYSNYNTFPGNNIAQNKWGVFLYESSNNRVYFNNFINNTVHAYVMFGSGNVWNDVYPYGGNYWDDYSGVDYYWGPNQNIPGSDGIGDMPYIISVTEGNQDNYPWMTPLDYPFEATIRAYCYTEGTYVSVSIAQNGNPTGYNTPATFTVGVGTNFTVPNIDAAGHSFKQWNTGQTTTTITVSGAGIYTAYYESVRDVAVVNVTPSKTVVGQGYSISINVTVENQGDFTETFNITVYANTTIIATLLTNITLTSGNSTTITFTWNTTGIPYGNYTITANATQVAGEIDTTDNTYTDCWVVVTISGNVDGTGEVDWVDLGMLGLAYGSVPGQTYWNPNADIDNSGEVDWVDLGMLGLNYGKSC